MDKKKIELNIEELEERIAPSVPICIRVEAGLGAIINDCSGDGRVPPEIVITRPSGEVFQPPIGGGSP